MQRRRRALSPLLVALLAVACAGDDQAALSEASAGASAGASTSAASASSSASSSGATTTGSGTSSSASASEGSSSGEATTGDAATCPCYAGEGPYCAAEAGEHALAEGCVIPALAGHEGDLLSCEGGAWSLAEACTEGCEALGSGALGLDACLLPVCSCYAGEGPYCGAGVGEHAAESGCRVPALAGHEGDVLTCEGDTWSVGESCSDGCEVTTPGEGDACLLPLCPCFVKVAWCGTGTAEHGLTMDPPCRVPLVPEHNDDILGCDGDEWIVKEVCELGCHANAMGVPDTCNDESSYRLPFACGAAFTCSQGNNGSSHTGSQKYAWDFAMPKGTPVHASRGGVVAYAEVRSPPGSQCYDPPGILEACHNKANFIGIRHADGTVALYLHLQSLKVKVGDVVKQGDKIGLSGNSGYTSGPHLHIQLQNECGIWFCQSVPLKFADAPNLAKGVKATSGNCP